MKPTHIQSVTLLDRPSIRAVRISLLTMTTTTAAMVRPNGDLGLQPPVQLFSFPAWLGATPDRGLRWMGDLFRIAGTSHNC